MKNKHVFITTLLLMALSFSCTDESKYPIDFNSLNNSNGGILKLIQATAITFEKLPAGGLNPTAKYEVVLEANDAERGKLFTKVELFVKFFDRTPANGNDTKAEVLMQTYLPSEFAVDPITGLPRITISQTGAATMALLGLLAPDIEGTDQFIFRQAMHLQNGQIFTSTNVGTAIANVPAFKSPFATTVSVICPSDLGGTVNYSTIVTGAVVPIAPCLPGPVTGTVQFAETGPGKYAVSDATFGQYDCAWNDNPAAGTNMEDACNNLTITGADQYGLLYGWVIVGTPGATLVIDWFNDYGDTGTTTLTRTGKTWPAGLYF